MTTILSILGLITFIGFGYLLSNDKKNINWKSVGLAFFGQIILAYIMIKTPVWRLVQSISNFFSWLLAQSTEGINFVFGGISDNFVFFINSLLPIVFISSLMGLLFHFGILQKIVSFIGKTIAKALNVDTLVSVNSLTNMFMGQSDSLFVTKSYLPNAKDSVIFATLVGGMTSISVSVLGLYTGLGAEMEMLIVSMPLTVLSTFALTQIVMPTKYEDDEVEVEMENDRGSNALETMMNYAQTGFKTVISISVALMVFLSLVFMVNNILEFFNMGLTLEKIFGIIFSPLAMLMGVPSNEVGMVSQILATKLITNETVAFGLPVFNELSMVTKSMVTVTLCGFAGISSTGIMLGAYQAIAPNKVPVVAKLGFKALIVATLVNIISGTIIGLVL